MKEHRSFGQKRRSYPQFEKILNITGEKVDLTNPKNKVGQKVKM